MTSNGKQFTGYLRNVTAVARVQRWPDIVAGISARFSNFVFVLFCYTTNHSMTGPMGNSEFCFLRDQLLSVNYPKARFQPCYEPAFLAPHLVRGRRDQEKQG